LPPRRPVRATEEQKNEISRRIADAVRLQFESADQNQDSSERWKYKEVLLIKWFSRRKTKRRLFKARGGLGVKVYCGRTKS
jgi:hypothetical protein